jgi:hypothetical protein
MTERQTALEAGICFRLTQQRIADLRDEASRHALPLQALLELKVFDAIAPRLRFRRDVGVRRSAPGAHVAFHFRMSNDQLAALHTEAKGLRISVQALLELKVFGEIAPRQRRGGKRAVQPVGQQPLGLLLADAQEASNAA